MNQHRGTVICAVGDDGSSTAVTVAANEAARLGTPLHLVRVTPLPDARGTDAVLDEAVALARSAHPDLDVTRDTVDRTWIAAGVTEAGRGARYVVIERTHRNWLSRLLSGSTAEGISFKVETPVLSVPCGWRPDKSGSSTVTVAVQDAVEAPTLVTLAAAEAMARGADLVVLHAVNPARGHDEAAVDARSDWTNRAHLQLDPPIRAVADLYPDLKVRLDVIFDRPADALVHASLYSMLLVAGRRHHEHAWGTHVGPVVRRVLLDAACPVLLAPDGAIASLETSVPEQTTRHEPDQRPPPGDVVVAIGNDDAGGSVGFSVAEASTRGVGLHLVHVVRMPAVDGVSAAEVWRDAVAHGRTLLARAADQAREAAGPHLRLTQHLVDQGGLVHDLVTEASRAGLIVVQHRRLGRARRLVTWSVTNGLAARTDVPVVAVPAEWSSGPERIGCVVVGLQDDGDTAHLLPIALEEASRRGVPLRVVRAGRLSVAEREELRTTIEDAGRAWPDVRVDQVVQDAEPVALLVGAMTAAELVVVGRRHHAMSHRSHLGPVARRVLDESTYPVMLAPAAHTAN